MPNCIVPTCSTSHRCAKLFLAPYTNKPRWEAWCKVCPFLLDLRPMQLQNARFCPLHFKPTHIVQNKLTVDAIPVLYLDQRVLQTAKEATLNVNIEDVDTKTLAQVPCSPPMSSQTFIPQTPVSSNLVLPTTPVQSNFPIHSRIRNRSNLTQQVRVCLGDTPRKQKLRLTNKALKAKYRLMSLKYQNLKRKWELNCPKTVQLLKKYNGLNKFGKVLVDSQMRLNGVKPKGRRYTGDEKVFALSLFKLSPKCYAFLRKYLILPCKSRLNSLLTSIPLRPGINDFIMQHLADAAVGKSIIGKQCTLLFDEMAIGKNLHFNFHTGVIEGFEDLGSGKRSSNVADKALVFMLRGLFYGWKFPLAFYFARDGVKTFVLKNIIREIISAVSNAGFVVRATVSDQGSANVAAIKSLIADTHADLLRSQSNETNNIYYKVDNVVVYHIFDVPHLLKCFRNNFQKKDVLLPGHRAQWIFLEKLYAVDGAGGRARSTKLTDKHINPQSYDKMKVEFTRTIS